MVVLLPLVQAATNGLALLPPMGWRSWNCFYADIDDAKIRGQIDALVKPRDADGRSLHSLGFDSVGIDEGWEGCNMGVNRTVHYVNGTPTVDPKRFPDMPALVQYGHAKGVEMGFYLNGCGCNEKRELTVHRRPPGLPAASRRRPPATHPQAWAWVVHLQVNYAGDVRATVDWGFDSVKIDSCGAQKNMTLYYELFNATGKPIQIEECHQGQNITDGGNPGQMSPGWCPYNFFRTSGDIVNLWDRVMSNLMTVVPFLSPPKESSGSVSMTPVSRPGCWAYPDMLSLVQPLHPHAHRTHLPCYCTGPTLLA